MMSRSIQTVSIDHVSVIKHKLVSPVKERGESQKVQKFKNFLKTNGIRIV